jgi:hypothetical protein
LGLRANWVGTTYLLKRGIEGKIVGRIEVAGGQGSRRKQLFDDLDEDKRGCKLKKEVLDRSLWRTGF